MRRVGTWLGVLAALFVLGKLRSESASERTPHEDAPASLAAETSGRSKTRHGGPTTAPATRSATLPPEAYDTLELIARGGPFPHRQDGVTFQNREKRLPSEPSGYYREYTVETPGSRDRGARRIITGGDPPEHWYFTDDHYRTFRELSDADRRRL